MTDTEIEQVAQVAYEAVRAYHNDEFTSPWGKVGQETRDRAIAEVRALLSGYASQPHAGHDAWCEEMRSGGWKHGTELDEQNKLHPRLVPYHELPFAERMQETLFRAVVKAFSTAS